VVILLGDLKELAIRDASELLRILLQLKGNACHRGSWHLFAGTRSPKPSTPQGWDQINQPLVYLDALTRDFNGNLSVKGHQLAPGVPRPPRSPAEAELE